MKGLDTNVLVRYITGDFSGGGADLADYYIGHANDNYGASTTLTFDKALKTSPLFTVL